MVSYLWCRYMLVIVFLIFHIAVFSLSINKYNDMQRSSEINSDHSASLSSSTPLTRSDHRPFLLTDPLQSLIRSGDSVMNAKPSSKYFSRYQACYGQPFITVRIIMTYGSNKQNDTEHNNVISSNSLIQLLNMQTKIDKELNEELNAYCLKVYDSCYKLSPLDIWDNDAKKIKDDENNLLLTVTRSSYTRNSQNMVVPIKSVFGNPHISESGLVTGADAFILTYLFQQTTNDCLKDENCMKNKTKTITDQQRLDNIQNEMYKIANSFNGTMNHTVYFYASNSFSNIIMDSIINREIWLIVIGVFSLFLFITFLFPKSFPFRPILAFVTLFLLLLGIVSGLLVSWLVFNTSVTFFSLQTLPFLLLAISIDGIFLISYSVLEHEGRHDAGDVVSVFIHLLPQLLRAAITVITIFIIVYIFNDIDAIQWFCLQATICVFINLSSYFLFSCLLDFIYFIRERDGDEAATSKQFQVIPTDEDIAESSEADQSGQNNNDNQLAIENTSIYDRGFLLFHQSIASMRWLRWIIVLCTLGITFVSTKFALENAEYGLNVIYYIPATSYLFSFVEQANRLRVGEGFILLVFDSPKIDYTEQRNQGGLLNVRQGIMDLATYSNNTILMGAIDDVVLSWFSNFLSWILFVSPKEIHDPYRAEYEKKIPKDKFYEWLEIFLNNEGSPHREDLIFTTKDDGKKQIRCSRFIIPISNTVSSSTKGLLSISNYIEDLAKENFASNNLKDTEYPFAFSTSLEMVRADDDFVHGTGNVVMAVSAMIFLLSFIFSRCSFRRAITDILICIVVLGQIFTILSYILKFTLSGIAVVNIIVALGFVTEYCVYLGNVYDPTVLKLDMKENINVDEMRFQISRAIRVTKSVFVGISCTTLSISVFAFSDMRAIYENFFVVYLVSIGVICLNLFIMLPSLLRVLF